MSDLISRQALCEYALNQKDKSITPNEIMRFPSAEPVRHGKWIETDEWDEFSGRLYKCSNCKTFVLGYFDNYCPYCGSMMDEE